MYVSANVVTLMELASKLILHRLVFTRSYRWIHYVLVSV